MDRMSIGGRLQAALGRLKPAPTSTDYHVNCEPSGR